MSIIGETGYGMYRNTTIFTIFLQTPKYSKINLSFKNTVPIKKSIKYAFFGKLPFTVVLHRAKVLVDFTQLFCLCIVDLLFLNLSLSS